MQLEFGDGEQVLGRIRQQPEAIDHLHLQVAQFVRVARAADALVQRQACVHVGQVVLGDQRGHVEHHVGAAAFERGILVRQLALADRTHRALQQFRVEAEAHFRHLAALVFAEQLARAADFQVVRGEGEARAEFVHRGDGIQALARIGGDVAVVGDHQVGVGAMVRTSDAAAQLVQAAPSRTCLRGSSRSCWRSGCRCPIR
jgi:hypothetical protein